MNGSRRQYIYSIINLDYIGSVKKKWKWHRWQLCLVFRDGCGNVLGFHSQRFFIHFILLITIIFNIRTINTAKNSQLETPTKYSFWPVKTRLHLCTKAGITPVHCGLGAGQLYCILYVVLGELPSTSVRPCFFIKAHQNPACFVLDVLSEYTGSNRSQWEHT